MRNLYILLSLSVFACNSQEANVLSGNASGDLELEVTWSAPADAEDVNVEFSSYDLCQDMCVADNNGENALSVVVVNAPDSGTFSISGTYTKGNETFHVCTVPDQVNGQESASLDGSKIHPTLGYMTDDAGAVTSCTLEYAYSL